MAGLPGREDDRWVHDAGDVGHRQGRHDGRGAEVVVEVVAAVAEVPRERAGIGAHGLDAFAGRRDV